MAHSIDDVIRSAQLVRSSTAHEYDTYAWALWALKFLRGIDRTAESALAAERSVAYVAEPWIREALEAATYCATRDPDGFSTGYSISWAMDRIRKAAKLAGLPRIMARRSHR